MVFLDYLLNLVCTVLRYIDQATTSDPESLLICHSLLHAKCCGEHETIHPFFTRAKVRVFEV